MKVKNVTKQEQKKTKEKNSNNNNKKQKQKTKQQQQQRFIKLWRNSNPPVREPQVEKVLLLQLIRHSDCKCRPNKKKFSS